MPRKLPLPAPARSPRIPDSALFRGFFRFSPAVFSLPTLVAAVLISALFGGCAEEFIYRPVNFEAAYDRPALFLPPLHVKPISKEVHEKIVSRVEEELARSPYWGRIVTRKEFQELAGRRAALRRDYLLAAETLTELGVAERGLSARLGRATGTELLVSAQVAFIPCRACENLHRLYVIGYVVEAETGTLLWRAHIVTDLLDDSPANIAEEAEALGDSLIAAMSQFPQPTWHRLRFRRLAGRGPFRADPASRTE